LECFHHGLNFVVLTYDFHGILKWYLDISECILLFGRLMKRLLQAVMGLRERYFGPSYELHSHDKVILYSVLFFALVLLFEIELNKNAYRKGIHYVHDIYLNTIEDFSGEIRVMHYPLSSRKFPSNFPFLGDIEILLCGSSLPHPFSFTSCCHRTRLYLNPSSLRPYHCTFH
jgi:hypothetical protein